MAIFDKIKQGFDKAGKAAQDVFDEGKLRIDSYRAREQADKAAEALGYAVFRAWESGAELDADARERLMGALRTRETEARTLETELADAKANNEGSTASSTSGSNASTTGDSHSTAAPGATPPPVDPAA
jgi:hypothetical protein